MDNTEGVVTTFNDEQLDKNNYKDSKNGDYNYEEIVKLVNAKIDSIKTEHKKNVNNTKGELGKINTRIKDINTRLQAIIAALEKTKLTVDENNDQIAKLTEEKQNLEKELGNLNQQKGAVDKELTAANQKIAENERKITNLTSELAQKEEEKNTVKQEIEALTATGTQKENEIKKLTEQYEKNKLADDKENEGKIKALKTQHDKEVNLLKAEKSTVDDELSKANADLKQKETDYESLDEKFKSLQDRAQQNFQQVQDIKDVQKQCAESIKNATEEVTNKLQPQIDELDQLNTILKNNLEQAHKALDGIITKLKGLKLEGADFTDLIKQINELLKTTETSTTTIEGQVGINNEKTTENSSKGTAKSTTFQGVPDGTFKEIKNGFEANAQKNSREVSPLDEQKNKHRRVEEAWKDTKKQKKFQKAMGIKEDKSKIPGLPVPGNMAVNKRMNDGDDGDDDDDDDDDNQFSTTIPMREVGQSQNKRHVIGELNDINRTKRKKKKLIEEIKGPEDPFVDVLSDNEDDKSKKGGKRRKFKGKTRKVRKHATKKKRKPLVGGKKRKQTRKRRSRKAKKANKKK